MHERFESSHQIGLDPLCRPAIRHQLDNMCGLVLARCCQIGVQKRLYRCRIAWVVRMGALDNVATQCSSWVMSRSACSQSTASRLSIEVLSASRMRAWVCDVSRASA